MKFFSYTRNKSNADDTRLSFHRYGFIILELENPTNANEVKLKFVKYKDGIKDGYSVQLIKETKDLKILFNENEILYEIPSPLPGVLTASKRLNYCIDEISSKLLKFSDSGFLNVVSSSGLKKFRLNVFFGREIFFLGKEEIFSLDKWINFNRKSENFNTTFQHYVPQFLEKLPHILKELEFQEMEEKEMTFKESISIYFKQDKKFRMVKLKYNTQERLWKSTGFVYDNLLSANLDIISGTEDPDCRLSMKIRRESYDMNIVLKIEKIVNEIQLSRSFKPRDGMWFRVKDFEGKLENVEVRQTIKKRRFVNKHFQISINTVKKDAKGKLLDQQIISLEHQDWRDMENENILSHEKINNTIHDTVQYARKFYIK